MSWDGQREVDQTSKSELSSTCGNERKDTSSETNITEENTEGGKQIYKSRDFK
jgi:hypothetical protein